MGDTGHCQGQRYRRSWGITRRKTSLSNGRVLALLRFIALTAAVGLASANFGFGPADAQETISVRGNVLNGTADAAVPLETPVLMLVSDGAGNMMFTGQTLTDQWGGFRFDDVPMVDEGAYAFSVDYEAVFYDRSFNSQDVLNEVQLTVYETTQDASVVKVVRQVLVISGINEKDREISAIEFVQIKNDSDRTLLPDLTNPGRLSFLRFALPLQAGELDVRSNLPGGDVVSIDTGFAIISPVLPGDHNVEFSFRFPYAGDSVSYRQSLPQGAEVYQILVPQRLGQVEVKPLRLIPSIGVDGSEFRVWEERGYVPGQGAVLEFANLPQPGFGIRLQKSITDGASGRIAIPAAVCAVLAVLLLIGLFRSPRRVALFEDTSNDRLDLDLAQRENLVRQVAILDEEFQQGIFTEREYQLRREALVTRVGARVASAQSNYE